MGEETLPLLPQGNHQATWFVNSSCNEQSTCTFPLTIQAPAYIDTIAPVVNCINGLSINQMNGPTNTVTLWAYDFLVNATDNITPGNLIKYGLRKSGTGTGFPMTNGVAQTSVTFNCNELGTNLVELWAMDEAGNSDFCETYVLVQDNTGSCEGGEPPVISGRITTEQSEGVEDVAISIPSLSPVLPGINSITTTNQAGNYIVYNALAFPPSFEIKPKLDTDPLNGVNTWDLVLISRHILNLQPLNTPYKLIAADANKSGTVTTFDIVELRKLLLGTYSALPNNSSWRFVDKYQVFNSPDNPFANVIRESILVSNINWIINPFDFVGIKIGDLDNTATPNNIITTDDRNAPFTTFNISRNDANHWLINKGEPVELTFSNPTTLSGYQMTLKTDGIQPSEVVPGEGMSNDNFGVFDHAVTTVFEQGNTPFSIRFTAEESGDLRDMIQVSSRITPAMAFGENGEKMQVNLRFEGEKSSISPNPWSNHTRINFHATEATTATLKVMDMAGRSVYTSTVFVEKGEQSFELNDSLVPVTGILIYEITTDNGVISSKMSKQ